jgi:HSP20 family protein
MKKNKKEISLDTNLEKNTQNIYKYLSLEMTKETELLGETSFVPLDIYEDQEYFYIELEIPGVCIDDIQAYLSEKNLVIEGIKHDQLQSADQINFLCMERKFGPFRRIIKVPCAINPHKIRADYKNGILTLHIPKNLERRKKTLKINITGEK